MALFLGACPGQVCGGARDLGGVGAFPLSSAKLCAGQKSSALSNVGKAFTYSSEL